MVNVIHLGFWDRKVIKGIRFCLKYAKITFKMYYILNGILHYSYNDLN